MAVTDTGTLTELVQSEVIHHAVLEAARDAAPSAPYVNWMQLTGSNTGSFAKWVLDTATDITNETTSLSNETLETTEVSIVAAEVGIRRDISDVAVEASVIGSQLFDYVVDDSGQALGLSLEDDICALFSSFSTSVGATGVNLSVANMVEAQAQVRTNGHHGQLCNILHVQQAADYQAALASGTGTVLADFFQMETSLEGGGLGSFMGNVVWASGSVDLVNTSADRNGACFVRGDTNPRQAAIGGVLARGIRTEEQRDASLRLTEIVTTARWGVGEISDLSGTGIVTDA